MDRISATLINPQQAYQWWLSAWQTIKPLLIAGHRLHVEVRPEKRSDAQNDLMWSCLTDLSRALLWPIDGQMQRLSPEEWKHIMSAGLKKEQRVAHGVGGGFVILGQRTSKMSKAQMTELIDLIHAFGDERGVQWSRTSLGRDWPEEMTA